MHPENTGFCVALSIVALSVLSFASGTVTSSEHGMWFLIHWSWISFASSQIKLLTYTHAHVVSVAFKMVSISKLSQLPFESYITDLEHLRAWLRS